MMGDRSVTSGDVYNLPVSLYNFTSTSHLTSTFGMFERPELFWL